MNAGLISRMLRKPGDADIAQRTQRFFNTGMVNMVTFWVKVFLVAAVMPCFKYDR